MPFDPFFSSAKQHATFCEGEQELWDKIHAMPHWERKKELASWRGREMSQAERNVRRRISIALLTL